MKGVAGEERLQAGDVTVRGGPDILKADNVVDRKKVAQKDQDFAEPTSDTSSLGKAERVSVDRGKLDGQHEGATAVWRGGSVRAAGRGFRVSAEVVIVRGVVVLVIVKDVMFLFIQFTIVVG